MLIHCIPSLKFGIALGARYRAVGRIVVLLSPTLRGELFIALSTLETVSRVIMLVQRILRLKLAITFRTAQSLMSCPDMGVHRSRRWERF